MIKKRKNRYQFWYFNPETSEGEDRLWEFPTLAEARAERVGVAQMWDDEPSVITIERIYKKKKRRKK